MSRQGPATRNGMPPNVSRSNLFFTSEHRPAGYTRPPESNWILSGGTWHDTGVWEDTAVWED